MKKYEAMTKEQFAEFVLESVSNGLDSKGMNTPIMTEEQKQEVSFETSVYESRIKFYPEENREVVVTVVAREVHHD